MFYRGNVTFDCLRFKEHTTGNNYYHNVYCVISKTYNSKGHEVAVHLGYRYYPSYKKESRTGAFAGLTYRPAFFHPFRFMAEYDGMKTNIGADALLWKSLFVQVGLIHWKGFFGGLSYHYRIPF